MTDTEDLFNCGNVRDLTMYRQDEPAAADLESLRIREKLAKLQRIWDWANWMRAHGYMPEAVREAWDEYWGDKGPWADGWQPEGDPT
jgi:hypothetical protein